VKTAKQQQTFVRSCKLTKNFPFPPPFPFCCCTSSASKRPKEACVTKKPNCSGTVTVKHEVHRHCNSIGKKYLGLIKFFQRSTPGTTNTNIHSKKEGYRVRIRFPNDGKTRKEERTLLSVVPRQSALFQPVRPLVPPKKIPWNHRECSPQ
jgi:hypothetical protein